MGIGLFRFLALFQFSKQMERTLVEPGFDALPWILKVIETIADFSPLTPDLFHLIADFQFISEQTFIIFDVGIIKESTLLDIFQHTLKIGAIDATTTNTTVDIDVTVVYPYLVLRSHLTAHGDLGFDSGRFLPSFTG